MIPEHLRSNSTPKDVWNNEGNALGSRYLKSHSAACTNSAEGRRRAKCHMIEMNNVTDHVHILFDLHRTEALADVVMHVKKDLALA